jgi:hypothetical protein
MGAQRTPEQQVKHEIMAVLKHVPQSQWRWIQSVGQFEAKRGIFRRQRGRWASKGVADILGCIAGHFVAIEVKSKTGVLSNDQRLYLEQVNRAGGTGFVARSAQEVVNHLRHRFRAVGMRFVGGTPTPDPFQKELEGGKMALEEEIKQLRAEIGAIHDTLQKRDAEVRNLTDLLMERGRRVKELEKENRDLARVNMRLITKDKAFDPPEEMQ